MLWAALLVASGAAIGSGPVYLTCDVGENGDKRSASLTLDESNQRVVLALPTGVINQMPAAFDPTTVTFGERIGSETIYWHISRVDLTVRQTATFSDHVETGTCKLQVAPPKRAF